MPKIKTYSLINFRFLFASFLFLFSVLMCWFCIVGATESFPVLFNPNYKAKFLAIFLYVLLFYLFYRFIQLGYMYLRYLWHDKFTRIVIDFENEIIIVKDCFKSYIFNSDNLKVLEFHLSTKDYRNPLYNFGYTRLITHDGHEVIVTSFVLNYLNVENILNRVKKIKKLDEIIFLP